MGLFKKKVTIDDELMDRIRVHVENAGFATAEEFIGYCIDKELAASGTADGDDNLHEKRLRGLGYIE